MSDPVSQKDYLKRYLGGGDQNKKKKKKKKDRTGTTTKGMRIVEDSLDIASVPYGYVEEDDAPTIAEVTYEDEKIKHLEEFEANKKWKKIVKENEEANNESGEEGEVRHDSDGSPPRRQRHDSDGSPPRRQRHDSDGSPPRRLRHDSDGSPPRQQRHDSDGSPPRRPRHDSDGSPRIQRHDSDGSPPRRQRHDSDSSPPRKVSKDLSPPRRKRNDSDSSPPRKVSKDLSPPRRKRNDSDSSPPRRKRNDSDSSPPRKKGDEHPIPSAAPEVRPERKMTTQEYLRARKFGKLKKDTPEDLARKGREAELQRKAEEQHREWRHGVKQVQDYQQKVADEQYEMGKSFARSADDVDMNDQLKSVTRHEDPMLEYMEKKKEETSNQPLKPKYKGPFPPNRLNIRPGYRWDGVDRSTGFEKQWFERQNNRRAIDEDAYKWSVSDM